jgi:predicted nucleic acid-binding protein
VITYVDSSIVLRKLFDEPGQLEEWSQIESAYASHLIVVEVGRVVDRSRLLGLIDDEDVARVNLAAKRALRSITLLALTQRILDRAAAPMPTVVGSLDALHLATALELAPTLDGPLVLATHDIQLARAAHASGLETVGVV